MPKLILTILYLQVFSIALFAQDKEKMIGSQSLLIDALKEEQIGNKDKAIELLEKLKYEPDFKGVSNFYLAKLYRSIGKMEEAFVAIDQSILFEPDNTWYLILKTNMTVEYGKYLETAETFEKLCALEPVNFSHYDNAAYFYLKAEEFKKALDILNKAEHTFGIMPSIAIKKSYVLTFLKKDKNALEELETCYNQFPNNKELLIELIKSYAESNNPEQVSKYVEKLKKIDPDNEELKRLIHNHDTTVNTKANLSVDEMVKAPEFNLDDKIKFIFTKLNGFVARGDKQGIQSLLTPAENLARQFPAEPKTFALIGDIYFQMNDFLQAKTAYAKSITIGRVPYPVWDNLLFCLIHLNHWKTASFLSQKCMDLYPNQSFPNYVYILCKLKLKQLDDIMTSVNQLELMVNYNDHKKTEVLILKARILSELNNQEESDKAWKSALELDHDYLASLEYCVALASKGIAYPKDYFEKAMKSEFINESFKLDKAAQLYYYSKDYSKAKEYIDNSISKGYCESADSLILASKIYEALGLSGMATEFKDKSRHIIESESSDPIQQNIQTK